MATITVPEAAVGVFEDRTQAERAVEELRRAGFRPDQIGVAARSGDVEEPPPEVDTSDTAEGSAVAGALTGGAFGAILGALAAGLVPGVGWVVAGGILAGVVGGAAVGAAAGGLLGALLGFGLSEEEARFYEHELRAGRTIVTVKADGRHAEASAVLRRFGGYGANPPSSTAVPPLM